MSEFNVKLQIRRKLDSLANMRVLKALSTGESVPFGSVSRHNFVLHLGPQENIRVEIPIANILKCEDDDCLQALIETQYAIALLKGEKRC